MKTIKVKELMTPTADYPGVSRKATLREAMLVLEQAEKRFDEKGSRPRSVLVLDENDRVIGKLSHWDVLRALEPKYRFMGDSDALSHYGWAPAFIKSMVNNYGLLQKPFNDACCEAAKLKIDEIMTPFEEREVIHHEKEIIESDACLNEAIHLFVTGNLMTLFVREKSHIIGVLRLSDVFKAVSAVIKRCPLNTE